MQCINFFLRKPLFALALNALIVLAGIAIFPTLSVSQFPFLPAPSIKVTATLPGSTASSIEQSVTAPLEAAIEGTEGLDYTTSSSASDGSSTLTLTFERDYDIDRAVTDVEQEINRAQPSLPAETVRQGITVQRNGSLTLTTFAFSTKLSATHLIELGNWIDQTLVRKIDKIPGVARVIVDNPQRESMRIWLNPQAMSALDVSLDDIALSLQRQNSSTPGGTFGGPPDDASVFRTYSVFSDGTLHSAEDFRNVEVRTAADGSVIRLKDVARIEVGSESYNETLTYHRQNTIGIDVQQAPGSNAIEVSRKVRVAVTQLARSMPSGSTYAVVHDRGDFVDASLKEVVAAMILSTFLVIIVVTIALRDVRLALIPVISLIVSLSGTVVVLRLLGFSLNLFTLLGMTLACGLVVDDAIVFVEHIARRTNAQDIPSARLPNVRSAMLEIWPAVLSSTLVILTIFVPACFAPGPAGLLYRQLGATICAAVACSLATSSTLSGTLYLLTAKVTSKTKRQATNYCSDLYGKLLTTFARSALFCILLLCVTFGAIVMLVNAPKGFLPVEDQGVLFVNLASSTDSSLQGTTIVANRAAALIQDDRSVANVFEDVGQGVDGVVPNEALFLITLKPFGERTQTADMLEAVVKRLDDKLARLRGGSASIFLPSEIPGLGNRGGISFQLLDVNGHGREALTQSALTLAAEFNRTKGLFHSVSTDVPGLIPTYVYNLNRRKIEFAKIDLSALLRTFHAMYAQAYAADYYSGGTVHHAYFEGDLPYRKSPDDLGLINIGGNPMSTFVKPSVQLKPVVINHFNGFPSINIHGRADGGSVDSGALSEIQTVLGRAPGYDYEFTGLTRDALREPDLQPIFWLIGLAITLLLLIVLYGSLRGPLTIIVGAPIALIGSVCALSFRHARLDIFSEIGVLVLVSVVIKNGILIVDLASRLQKQGISAMEAAVFATQTRLRPVLMTAVALVAGSSPLIFAGGAGAGARESLGFMICIGTTVATLINILATPMLYVAIASLPRPGSRRSISEIARDEAKRKSVRR